MTIPVHGLKTTIIAVCLIMVLNVTGCGKNKEEQALTVYPVFNNGAANSYIAAYNGEALVIDPSEPEKIIAVLIEKGLKPKYIVLTHGHFDHILGVDSLVSRFPAAEVLIHPLDREKLADPKKNVSSLFGTEVRSMAKNSPVKENDIITIGNRDIRIIETPGHTQGSIILVAGNSLFSGDTLFKGAVGRTDFPGSSGKALADSLKKIISLKGDFTIYPGHGDLTTLKEEKKTNPYLKPSE